jgi:Zn-dependent protease with chaperone function
VYFTVYALLLAPAVLAWLASAVSRHLAPAAAVRVLTCLATVAAGATVWGLAVLAVGGLARTSQLQAYAHSSPAALAAADPVPGGLGAVAVVVLAVVVVRFAVTGRRRASGRRALSVVRSSPAAGDLIVLAGDHADAYALPGRPARIVVTVGMLRALSADERAVLLAHERAHLTHHHHRYTALAQAAAALNPLLNRVRDQIAFGIERWADEEAADAVASRQLAARSLARAALATTCVPGSPEALAYVRHRMAARVGALRTTCRPSRWSLLWPVATALLVTSVALIDVTVALVRCLNVLIP